jgi:novobiocin biosynthesis protein NovU/D-mycarose 3-C-methyltransferase
MRRTSCSACSHTDLEQFLDLGRSPIADAYTATADEKSPTYPLQVAVCSKCRLVQLLEVLDGQTLFGHGYSFYSSASPPLSAYHAAYAAEVRERYPDLVRHGVVEVGCNDGDMLRHFADLPHLGIDPAEGPAGVAQERGLDVLVRPFGLAAAHEVRDRRGRVGVVIANHVLAHVEDVADVLAGIGAILAPDGIAMVEVQYLPDLLVNNAFDLIYHEHRNFFSLSSLEQAAARHGLKVLDAELTDRQGGSLRVTLGFGGWVSGRVAARRASETWLNSFGAYEGMQGRAERIRYRLVDLIVASGTVAVYGAPAKATTLLNFCGLTSADLAWCEDTTEAKQGRHIPGTGIPIVKPGGCGWPDAYVLAAWNYSGPIMANNPGNTWIVPFPAPMVYG